MKNWFYRFLLTHKKLYDLQIGYIRTCNIMTPYINKITVMDKEFFVVTKRHFNKQIVNNRILNIYKTDISNLCIPIIEEFLKIMSADNFIYNHQKISQSSNKNYRNHFSNYISHSYELVEKAYELSKVESEERHIHIIVAFDGVTNALHHSKEICEQISKQSPISGNLKQDALIINEIVRRDIMNNDINAALDTYCNYVL